MLNTVANDLGPQLLLAAMVFDGVLERHPKLTVVVEEVGVDWLPHLVSALDAAIGRKPDVLVDDEYRPSNLVVGETYTLPLTPVEYLPPPGAGDAAARRRTRSSPSCGPRSRPSSCASPATTRTSRVRSDAVGAVRAPAGALRRRRRATTFFGGVAELLGV